MINYLFQLSFGKQIMVSFSLLMCFSFGIVLIMTLPWSKNQFCHDVNFLEKTEECTPANTSSQSIIVTAILPSLTPTSVNTIPNTNPSTSLGSTTVNSLLSLITGFSGEIAP